MGGGGLDSKWWLLDRHLQWISISCPARYSLEIIKHGLGRALDLKATCSFILGSITRAAHGHGVA